MLRISKHLSLPTSVVTQTNAFLGVRGSGKSYLAMVLAEEMVKAGLPMVALDPLGGWFGLRSSADGKKAGLPVAILGGDHGDVPIEPASGATIADWLVKNRYPTVIDLSLFKKAEQRRFVTDFSERLFQKNREALHIFLEECDSFVPQRVQADQARMVGAIEDLVRRGRARGLGISLISQRSAVVNKDVLTQTENLFALRTPSPHDRKAIEAWIEVHGNREERDVVINSLPSLETGRAWFWSPHWQHKLEKIRVRKKETYDSSATPVAGKRKMLSPKMGKINIDTLKDQLASTIQKADADNPKKLRARIAELEKELAKTQQQKASVQEAAPVVKSKDIDRLEKIVEKLRATASQVSDSAATFGFAISETRESRRKVAAPTTIGEKTSGSGIREKQVPRPSTSTTPAVVGSGVMKILVALAQHGAMNKRRLALISGYKHSGGTYNTYLSQLSTRGFISRAGGEISLTQEGVNAIGDHVEPLPVGHDLIEYWCGKLGKGEAAILSALCNAGEWSGEWVSKPSLAATCGYEPNGGTFNTYLSKLSTLGLIERRAGEIRVSEEIYA